MMNSRAGLWEQIQLLRREHAITILLTTHYLDEADQMAERIVIVDKGQVIADGTANALKADLAGDWLHITTSDTDAARAAAGLASPMAGVCDGHDRRIDGGELCGSPMQRCRPTSGCLRAAPVP